MHSSNSTGTSFFCLLVCETCFELDGVYLGGAIFADVIMTAALMAFIYRRTKKVSGGPIRCLTTKDSRNFLLKPHVALAEKHFIRELT